MGGNVGKAIITEECDMVDTIPPSAESIRSFAELADEHRVQNQTNSELTVTACPTGVVETRDGEEIQIGPYNAQSLAGQALSLSAALSPDYLQAYLSGLEDLRTLGHLPEPNRRKRR